MRRYGVPILPLLVLWLAGCGSTDDRQWMKVDQRYTTDEFRRDYAACSPKNNLDEDCMRRRGWIEVSRSKTERDLDPRKAEPARPRSTPGGFSGLSVPR